MYSQAINSKPPKSLLRTVGRAMADYGMIQAGDRLLVGVSGGKDSLSLLNILLHLRRYAPIKFDLAAMTVDPQIEGFDPSPLKDYMAAKGVTYFYQSQARWLHYPGDRNPPAGSFFPKQPALPPG